MSLSRIAKKDLLNGLIQEATKSAPLTPPKQAQGAEKNEFERMVESHSTELKKRETPSKAESAPKKEKAEKSEREESEGLEASKAAEESRQAREERAEAAPTIAQESKQPEEKPETENGQPQLQDNGPEVNAAAAFDAAQAVVSMEVSAQAVETREGIDDTLSTVGESVEGETLEAIGKTVNQKPGLNQNQTVTDAGLKASHRDLSAMAESILQPKGSFEFEKQLSGDAKDPSQQASAPEQQKNLLDTISAIRTPASPLTTDPALDLRNLKAGNAGAPSSNGSLDAAKALESAQGQAVFTAAMKKAGKLLNQTRPGKIQTDKSIQTQVVDALRSSLQSKKNEVEIRLDPPEWGAVRVKVEVRRSEIQVSFLAEHAFVKEALDRGLAGLRHAFAQEGLNLGQLSVGLGDGQAWKENREEQAGNARDLAEETARKTQAPAGVATRARDPRSSLVDQVI